LDHFEILSQPGKKFNFAENSSISYFFISAKSDLIELQKSEMVGFSCLWNNHCTTIEWSLFEKVVTTKISEKIVLKNLKQGKLAIFILFYPVLKM